MDRDNRIYLSAVVPFFNERDNLEPLVGELSHELERIGRGYEIVLVDDGSTDGSRDIADGLTGAEPQLRVLHLDRNYGQSSAFLAGFAASQGEFIVTLDADLQNDPADIVRLLEWVPRYDVVVGMRRRRRDNWVRRASSRVANGIRGRVLGDKIRDTGCSLKVFRRDLVESLPRFQGVHRFLPLLMQVQGARVKQVVVGHRARVWGDSKYNIRNRLLRGIIDMAGVLWYKRRYAHYRTAYEASGAKRDMDRNVRSGAQELSDRTARE
jgi:glycosyltransferase involved in cell wall biosynthesis